MVAKKKVKKSSVEADVAELKAELAKLEQENQKLKKAIENEDTEKNIHPYLWLRRFAVVIFLTLGIVSFAMFNVASWIKNTALNTDAFVATMQPVLAEPAVQTAVQDEITNQLFARVDVEGELQKALPENIAFLAGPLASQVESFTRDKVGEVIQSPQVYDIWGQALYTIHGQLIKYIEDPNNDGTISVNDVYAAISNNVSQDKKISFLFNKTLPEKIGTITIAEVTWLPEARQYVKVLNTTPIVFFAVSSLSLLIAVAAATKRRNILLVITALTVIMMGSTLAALVYGNIYIGDTVQPQYAKAAQEVYETISQPLWQRTVGYLALSAVLFLIIFVTAPIPAFMKARKLVDINLLKLANKLLPEITLPTWVSQFIQYSGVIAWTVFAVIFIGIGVRIPPQYSEVKTAFITATILVLIIYIANVCLRSLGRSANKKKK